jgi:hypothetical protein
VWTAILTDPEAAEDGRVNAEFGRVKDGFDVFASLVRPLERRNNLGNISLGTNNSPATFASNFGPTSPRNAPSIFGAYDPLHTPTEFAAEVVDPIVAPEMQIWSDVLLARAMGECLSITLVGENTDTAGANTLISDYSMLPLLGTNAEILERANVLLCGGHMSGVTTATILTALNSVAAWANTPGTLNATEQTNRATVLLQLVCNSTDFFVQL